MGKKERKKDRKLSKVSKRDRDEKPSNSDDDEEEGLKKKRKKEESRNASLLTTTATTPLVVVKCLKEVKLPDDVMKALSATITQMPLSDEGE